MGEVIGEVLGNAVGVAVSPLPLVAVIMVLMAPGGRAKGAALVAGWLTGVVLVLAVFSFVGPLFSQDEPRAVVSVLKIVVGVLLLGLAVRAWRGRPRGDEVAEQPAWMGRVQAASAPVCLGTGVVLAAVNPKNLGLTAAAGGTIGASGLTTGAAVAVGAVFTVLASAAMLGALGGAVLAPRRSERALESLRSWLVANNTTVMVVLLLLLGSNMLGDGIRWLG